MFSLNMGGRGTEKVASWSGTEDHMHLFLNWKVLQLFLVIWETRSPCTTNQKSKNFTIYCPQPKMKFHDPWLGLSIISTRFNLALNPNVGALILSIFISILAASAHTQTNATSRLTSLITFDRSSIRHPIIHEILAFTEPRYWTNWIRTSSEWQWSQLRKLLNFRSNQE